MEIIKAEFVRSLSAYGEFPEKGLPQIAVVGKSNVGKSSLINCLTRRNKLAKTSSTPGKTRLINIFLLNDMFHLVDLPGYGYAKVSKQERYKWGEMMEEYFSKSAELLQVFHLVDMRHPPTKDDIQMNQYLRAYQIPFTVITTKSDKISRGQWQKHLAPIYRELLVQPWEVIPFSSENREGREKLLEKIEEIVLKDPLQSAEK
ncbi:MAG: YihA family ribosome biogenesis GTP-binding protein [Clostridiales bacterium]|nr:YihA family ribosome biogenesis GTP-binding protein [Clostridiales bacterium]